MFGSVDAGGRACQNLASHPDGMLARMSSRKGRISADTLGGFEVYRASKSALKQLMRTCAARARG